MKIELDRIAIWQPVLTDGINGHPHPRGTTYIVKGSSVLQTATAPLYRYVKNYELDDTNFSLIVRTFNTDSKAVEKALDKVATKLDKDTVLKALETATVSEFAYSDEYITGDK